MKMSNVLQHLRLDPNCEIGETAHNRGHLRINGTIKFALVVFWFCSLNPSYC